jgi:hypothetical protein
MSKHNNKWIHGERNFVMPRPRQGFMEEVGIYYLHLILDKNIGEEIVLIIYDPTDFIHDLAALKPFHFFSSSVAVNTSFGPVYSFIFWVTYPQDTEKSFAIFDKPVDLSKPQLIEPWIKLANQTHLHLLLVDKNYETQGFYEFENDFGFDEAVETISLLDKTRVKDNNKAEQEYFKDYSLPQLYEMVKDGERADDSIIGRFNN